METHIPQICRITEGAALEERRDAAAATSVWFSRCVKSVCHYGVTIHTDNYTYTALSPFVITQWEEDR